MAVAAPSRQTRRAGRPAGARRRLLTVGATFVVLLAAWQLYVATANSIMDLPTPVSTVQAAIEMTAEGELLPAIGSSFTVLAAGAVPAIIIGVLMGLLIGSIRQLDVAFGPYIFAFFATPFPALIPLFLLIFGLGFVGKVAIVFTLVWIAVLLQTIAGVKAVDDRYLEVARSLGSTGLRAMFQIRLPAALSFIVAGIRIAVGRALVGVVIAEFDTALTGLGALIFRHSQRLRLSEALVPAVVLALTGVVLTMILRRVERRLEVWKQAN
jgi:ABC-type nitrate/sulfonate/bicarbonate transport system permease component